MTAYEKLESRLKKLGLYDEWKSKNCPDVFATEIPESEKIVVFRKKDFGYTETLYDSFEELRDNCFFRQSCEQKYYLSPDNQMVASIARWFAHVPTAWCCPFTPNDVLELATPIIDEQMFVDDENDEDIPENLTEDETKELMDKLDKIVKKMDELEKRLDNVSNMAIQSYNVTSSQIPLK